MNRFLGPPLHITNFHHGWGTLYTAVYEPRTGRFALYWPAASLSFSLTRFQETALALSFAAEPHQRMRA